MQTLCRPPFPCSIEYFEPAECFFQYKNMISQFSQCFLMRRRDSTFFYKAYFLSVLQNHRSMLYFSCMTNCSTTRGGGAQKREYISPFFAFSGSSFFKNLLNTLSIDFDIINCLVFFFIRIFDFIKLSFFLACNPLVCPPHICPLGGGGGVWGT